jgi:hypothetical protein
MLGRKTHARFMRRYDAKVFHVGRAYLHERSRLVTDRKELAALRHK